MKVENLLRPKRIYTQVTLFKGGQSSHTLKIGSTVVQYEERNVITRQDFDGLKTDLSKRIEYNMSRIVANSYKNNNNNCNYKKVAKKSGLHKQIHSKYCLDFILFYFKLFI